MRRDELLREAERERVARSVKVNTARSSQLADRVLEWAGEQLIATGQRLQSNHRAVMTSRAMRTAQRR